MKWRRSFSFMRRVVRGRVKRKELLYERIFTFYRQNKIRLNDLTYSDICNIREQGIEEGYKIEFKSQWDENFKKKHLCQTIASFANAEGGWLLVGIEDGTGNYVGIEKQRSDFSQTIAQNIMNP
jgi:hypothetical protein